MVTEANDVSEAHPFSKFTVLNENSVKAYVQSRPEFSKLLDGPPEQWNAKETGDGNMNYVYVIQSSQNALVVKQALPYIRCIGESWPMTQVRSKRRRCHSPSLQDRIRIEAGWMTYQRPFCPEHVPLVHGFDKEMASMIMEYLPPPCVTLRGAIFEGHVFPNMATQIAELLSKTLFFSSTLALSSEAFRSKMVKFNNSELCKATEQVIFMDPYYETSANAYLKPELESEAAELRNDRSAKIAIGRLRNLFLSKPQAFIHADFHTGSVMVTQNALHVIDSEFAFYGPMAFDIGKFIGNLFLAYFALDGHITSPKRSEQQQWLLQSVTEVNSFPKASIGCVPDLGRILHAVFKALE